MAHRTRTPEEIERSMKAARDLKAKQTLKEQKKRILYAQYGLIAVGIIQFLLVAILISLGAKPIELIVDVLLGAMFIGLYFLSREKPALAFNIGTIAYVVMQVLVFMAARPNNSSGFTIDLSMLIKFIILMTLTSGIAALKRIPKSLMDKKDTGVLDDIQREL